MDELRIAYSHHHNQNSAVAVNSFEMELPIIWFYRGKRFPRTYCM